MKIISWNVNGIRAVHKKGELQKFLTKFTPDIFCMQETKCKENQIKNIIEEFSEFNQFYTEAEKAGYSGTSIWISKNFIEKNNILEESIKFISGMSDFYNDIEGRISRIDFTKENIDYSVLTVYFPNGGKSDEAWAQKLIFYRKFLEYVKFLESEEGGSKIVIFSGDVNVCHEPIDIARPKQNEGKIGFHPLERKEITHWINAGFKDVWREKNRTLADQYSWWSYRGGARERNVGWRLDYFFVPESLLDSVKNIQYLNEQMGSDHCPVVLEM